MDNNIHTSRYAQVVIDAIKRINNNPSRVYYQKPSHLYEHQSKGHFHLFPECFLQINGNCDVAFPDERIKLAPGDILLIPAGLNHYESTDNKNRFLNMVFMIRNERLSAHFASAKSRDRFESFDSVQMQSSRCRYISDTCNELVSISLEKNFPDKQQTLNSLTVVFLTMILDMIQSETLQHNRIHPKISACKIYIDNHLTSPELNVKKIAKNLNCSSDYLSHIFHRETGETISQFINHNRLRFAQQMLRESDLNISQVAYACGFRDPRYFSRLFTRQIGLNPREYRSQIL